MLTITTPIERFPDYLRVMGIACVGTVEMTRGKVENIQNRRCLMESRTLFCSWLLGAALAFSVVAQTPPVITMDTVMTGDELRTSGVGSLTPAQRAALDRWLSAYTLKVLQFAQNQSPEGHVTAAPSTYGGSSGGHWIKSKADNGAIIVLEDGSMWEVNSIDRIDTSLWLPVDNITVLKASSAVGEYKYTLVNTNQGEKALAKFLGKQ
jgi:hypothetical protein